MSTILFDLRYSLRTLRKSPSFAVAAILSLAIGIGATAAVFSIANALLLRPLPYKDPDRLVILWNRSPGLGITEDWFSTAQYFDIKNGHQRAGAGGHRHRSELQSHWQRRAGAGGHDPHVVESSSPAWHARRAGAALRCR